MGMRATYGEALNTFVFFVTLAFIPILESSMGMFDCDPKSRILQPDPSIDCDNRSSTILFFSLLLLIVYPLFFVGGIAIVFTSKRQEMRKNLTLWKNGEDEKAREEEIFKKYG